MVKVWTVKNPKKKYYSGRTRCNRLDIDVLWNSKSANLITSEISPSAYNKTHFFILI